jgi:sugar lactone lactonase YvrE
MRNGLTMLRSAKAAALLGALLLGSVTAALLPLNAAQSQPERSFGDVQVLAPVPMPGFPEGIAFNANHVYVSGPATFGTAGGGPSTVWAFNAQTGALAKTYTIQGEDLSQEHANSCLALDNKGRLYVLNTQLGIVRIDPGSGKQEQYSSPFPNIGNPFVPALPNDIAFDSTGNAYVTDSLQSTIWKVPAGGGDPQVWFQDARFDSSIIGANGIRIDPTGTKLYISVTLDNTFQGYIYTLPLVANPSAGDLQVFHHYALGEAPDGIAFGKSGKLYVALAWPTVSGISILNPDGTEAGRLGNPTSAAIPYNSPANIAFDNHGSLLVTNHASIAVNPAHFAVLNVYVGDKALPLNRPKLP